MVLQRKIYSSTHAIFKSLGLAPNQEPVWIGFSSFDL